MSIELETLALARKYTDDHSGGAGTDLIQVNEEATKNTKLQIQTSEEEVSLLTEEDLVNYYTKSEVDAKLAASIDAIADIVGGNA